MLNPSKYGFGLALQSAKGEAAAVPTYFLRCLEGSDIRVTPEPVTELIGEGTRMVEGISFIAGADVGGSLIILAQDEVLPVLNYLCLGEHKDLPVVSGAYPHVATVNLDEGVQYCTVFKQADKLYEVYPDVKVDTFRFETEQEGRGQLLRYTLGVVGIGLPKTYSKTPFEWPEAESKKNLFMWHFGASRWQVDDVDVAGISQWFLEGDNNLTVVPGELRTGYALAEGHVEIVCSARLVVEDLKRYNKYMYGVEAPEAGTPMTLDEIPTGAFKAKLVRPTGTNPERSYEVVIPKLEYAVGDAPTIVPDPTGAPVFQTLGGRVVKPDSGDHIKVTVVNGVEKYDFSENGS